MAAGAAQRTFVCRPPLETIACDFSDFSLGVRDSAHLIRRYIQYPEKILDLGNIHSRFW